MAKLTPVTMQDGNVSLVLPKKASEDGKRYNIAFRYGRDSDLYFAVLLSAISFSHRRLIGILKRKTPMYRLLGNRRIGLRSAAASRTP